MPLRATVGDVTVDQRDYRVERTPRLVEEVVFVGGFGGCGKSLFTPVLGSFKRVEIQKYNYPLEHICSLYFLRAVDLSVATTMIRMLTDLDLYNVLMARELNVRLTDMSSIFRNPWPWRYLRRLVQPGDAAAVERIRQVRPILQVLTHHVLLLSPPLFAALGERLRLIEIVRHPLYMVKQMHCDIERFGVDPRVFTICYAFDGRSVPFFARGWEEQYLSANPMDRVIFSLAQLFRLNDQVWQDLSERARAQVQVVPFEAFVLRPWPYLKAFEALLGTTMTPRTRRELRLQRVPRTQIADCVPHAIYKRCGWEPPLQGATERKELQRRRSYAAQYATPAGMQVLDQMCEAYEQRYLRGIL